MIGVNADMSTGMGAIGRMQVVVRCERVSHLYLCTPERQSLCESHRQRRWLTCWSYKFTLKTDGLTFYSLNGGSSDANYPAQAVGAIHLGQQPLYEVQTIAGQENGGWVPWDKGLASTKQPSEVKTPRLPAQSVPGAIAWPGETRSAPD